MNNQITLKITEAKPYSKNIKVFKEIAININNDEPIIIQAQDNVYYQLWDDYTSYAPENIMVLRQGEDLWLAFEGDEIFQPSMIIEGYYGLNPDGRNNLLIGLHEDGHFYAYIPETAMKNEAIHQLADQVWAGQVLGGQETYAAVITWWPIIGLLGGLGVVAAAAGGGKSEEQSSPKISIQSATAMEGNNLEFKVDLDRVNHSPTNITIKLTENSANLSTDINLDNIQYSVDSGKTWHKTHIQNDSFTATIPANSTQGLIIQVPTKDDYFKEQPESIKITATIDGSNTVETTGNISDETDPDAADTVYARIDVDKDSIKEGGKLTYTVALVDKDGNSVNIPADKTIDVTLDWSGAAAGGQDTSILPPTVQISGGSSSVFTVDTRDDNLTENSEELIATITNVSDNSKYFEAVKPQTINNGANVNGSSTTTNITDEAYAVINGDDSVIEGEHATYTVSLLDKNGKPITVTVDTEVTVQFKNISTQDADTQYSDGDTISVTIKANQSSAELDVKTINDKLHDDGEEYNLSITNVASTDFKIDINGFTDNQGTTHNSSITTTITDQITTGTEDTVYVALVNDARVTEGDGNALIHTLKLIDSEGKPIKLYTGQEISVELEYIDDTTSAADFTKTAKQTSITITGNDTGISEVDINNEVVDDTLVEGTEHYTLRIIEVIDNTNSFEKVAIDKKKKSVTGEILDSTLKTQDDTGNVEEGNTLTVDKTNGVLGNDGDNDSSNLEVIAVKTVDGKTITAGNVLTGTYGDLTLNKDGSYTYVAKDTDSLAKGEEKTVIFTYTASDGAGKKGEANLAITITGTNELPIALDGSITPTEDTPIIIGGQFQGIDTDGEIVTYTITKLPDEGTLTYTDDSGTIHTVSKDAANIPAANISSLTFTPAKDFDGKPSNITYTVTDNDGGVSKEATVILNDIHSLNDAPVANDDTVTGITEDGAAVSVPLSGSDVDGTIKSYTITEGPKPEQGTLLYDHDNNTDTPNIKVTFGIPLTPEQAATVVFKPTANYHGKVDPLNFYVTDNDGANSKPATVTFNDIANIDDAPIAQNDNDNVIEDDKIEASGNVLDNDINVDEKAGDILVITAIRTGKESESGTDGEISKELIGTYGKLIVNEDGSYIYKLDNNKLSIQQLAMGEQREEYFTYTVSDKVGSGAYGSSDTAELLITITGSNDRPVITINEPKEFSFTEQTDTSIITQTGSMVITDRDTSDIVQVIHDTEKDIFSFEVNGSSVIVTDEQQEKLSNLFKLVNEQGKKVNGISLLAGDKATEETVNWSFDATSEALDFIPKGGVLTIQYAIGAKDNQGVMIAGTPDGEPSSAETQYVTITINGTDDQPVLRDNVRFYAENATSMLIGNAFNDDDRDSDFNEDLRVVSFEIDGTVYTELGGMRRDIFVDGKKIGDIAIRENGAYSFKHNYDQHFHGDLPDIILKVDNRAKTDNPVTLFEGTETFKFTIKPDADAPILKVVESTVVMSEDAGLSSSQLMNHTHAKKLGFLKPEITDHTQIPERFGLIKLSGIDTGAKLFNGSEEIATNDGSVYIRLVDSNNMPIAEHITQHLESTIYTDLTVAQFEAITYLPAPQNAINDTVTMTVKEYEVDKEGVPLPDYKTGLRTNGESASQDVEVDIQAITDDKTLAWNNSASNPDGATTWKVTNETQAEAVLAEDTVLDLSGVFSANMGEDLDGSEQYWFEIEGLTAGQTVIVNDIEYVVSESGILNTAENKIAIDATTTAPQLKLTPPADYSGELKLKITLHSRDSDDDSTPYIPASKTTQTLNLDLFVTPVAGDNALTTHISTAEDTKIDFLRTLKITDTSVETTVESITKVTIGNIPEGWTIQNQNGVNVFTATQGNSGYSIGDGHAALDLSEIQQYTITPPAHSSKDADIEVTVTSIDKSADGLITSASLTTTHPLHIEVTPVAEKISDPQSDTDGNSIADLVMTPDHVYATAAREDTMYTLGSDGNFNLAAGWHNEDSSEKTFAHLTFGMVKTADPTDSFNAIAGAIFKYTDDAGTHEVIDNGNGIDVPVEALNSLQFIPPENLSDFNLTHDESGHVRAENFDQFRIKVEAITIDYDEDNHQATPKEISGESWLILPGIDGVADDVTITAIPASGDEDAGRSNGNRITDVSITDRETIDIPENAIDLNITPKSADEDGSEKFNLKITNIEDGTSIYYDDGNGLQKQAISDGKVIIENFDPKAMLKFVPPYNFSGKIDLKVSAQSIDGTDQGEFGAEVILPVTINDIADVVANNRLAIDPDKINGNTYQKIYNESALDNGTTVIKLGDIYQDASNINSYDDTDKTPEVVSFIVTGLADSFNLEQAAFLGGEGTSRQWAITKDQLTGTSGTPTILTAPKNYAGEITFKIQEVTTEITGNHNSALHDNRDIKLFITPDATDNKILNAETTIVEDGETQLDFAKFFNNVDTDATSGYETINSITITQHELDRIGLTLSINGTEQSGEAAYTFTTADTVSIQINNDPGKFGQKDSSFDLAFSYTVKDSVSDADGNEIISTTSAAIDGSYHIDITPVSDQPELVNFNHDTVTVQSGAGASDPILAFTKTITLTSPDLDGSEHFTRIVVKGVPEGIVIKGGASLPNATSGLNDWWVNIDDKPITSTDNQATFQLEFSVKDSLPPSPPAGKTDYEITVIAYSQDFGAEKTYQTSLTDATIEKSVEDSFLLKVDKRSGSGTSSKEMVKHFSISSAEISEDSSLLLDKIVEAELKGDINDASFSIRIDGLPEGTTLSLDPALSGVQLFHADNSFILIGQGNNADLQALLKGTIITPEEDFSTNNDQPSQIDPDGKLAPEISMSVWKKDIQTEYKGPLTSEIIVNPVTDEIPTAVIQNLEVKEDNDIELTLDLGNEKDGIYHRIVGNDVYLWLKEDYKDTATIAIGGNTKDSGILTTAAGDIMMINAGELPLDTKWSTSNTGGQFYKLSLPENIIDYSNIKLTYTPAQNNDGTVELKSFIQYQEITNLTGKADGAILNSGDDGTTHFNIIVTEQPDPFKIRTDKVTLNIEGKENDLIELPYNASSEDDSDDTALLTSLVVEVPKNIDGFDPDITVLYRPFGEKSTIDAKLTTNAGQNNHDKNIWSILVNANDKQPEIFLKTRDGYSGVLKDIRIRSVTNGDKISDDDDSATFNVMVNPVASNQDLLQINPTQTFGVASRWTGLNLNANWTDNDGSETISLNIAAKAGSQSLQKNMKFRLHHDDEIIDLSHKVTYDSDSSSYTITGLTNEQLNQLEVNYLPYKGTLAITPTVTDTAPGLDDTEVTNISDDFAAVDARLTITLPAEFILTDGPDEADYSAFKTAVGVVIRAGGSDDIIIGSDADDKIYGEKGNDTLYGGAGNDMLHGGEDNDYLDGGAGADMLYGYTGDDTIIFDAADTIISGGAGYDTLYIQQEDIILDFASFDASRLDQFEAIDMSGHGAQTISGLTPDVMMEIINDFTDHPVEGNLMQNKDLFINGDSDGTDTVNLVNGTYTWEIVEDTVEQNSVNYHQYRFHDSNGTHSLYIEDGINITLI